MTRARATLTNDEKARQGTAVIHTERYEPILAACQDIQRRRDRAARPVLSGQILARVGPETSNAELLAHIIAEALLRRIDHNLVESKNIYLESFDIPQIELFMALARAVPLVPASHAVANHHLAFALRRESRAGLLEIGAGRGVQLRLLLRSLREDPGRLERLRVVAVDPDPMNLAVTTHLAEALSRSLPFTLEVHAAQCLIERIDDAEFRDFAAWLGSHTAVNAAFTLHHTAHALHDHDFRTRLLARLRDHFAPMVFTLAEPHANHDTEMLARRLHESWQHFGAVFELIDRSEVPPAHRFVIKEKFFGRELRDIFGTSDLFRSERHESFESWLFRLAKAGFEPTEQPHPATVDLPSYCSASFDEGLVRLGLGALPVVAVFTQRARRRRESIV